MGTVTTTAPDYMSAANSAYAAAAEYGDLLNEDYNWEMPHGGNISRTGFNAGPAPDRPDVLFKTETGMSIPTVYLGTSVASGLVNPTVVQFGAAGFFGGFSSVAPMAMDGQIITWGSISVNSVNGTTRTAVISLDPHTGACNWASIIGYGVATGVSSGSSMAGSGYMFKVDDDHFATIGGGLSMFRSTGQFLWNDPSVNPGAVYHSILGTGEPISMVFGPHSVGGDFVPTCSGWTVEDPETDMGEGNRLVFDYLMDEPGNPMLAVGDGKLLMGSYSSCAVYAIDIVTGEKVWETWTQTAMGYMTCYHDGVFFIGTQSMHIYALDSEDGSVIWHNTDGVRNRAFNVWNINYAYGNIYLHDLGAGTTGAQKCLDAETGEMLWASPAPFYIGYYTTVVADGKVYGRQSDYSTTTGREATPINFACWDAFTGEVIWEIQEEIASPVIAYGCLYFMKGGQMYALSTAVEPQDYAMWRGSVETPSITLNQGPTDLSSPKWVFTTGAGVISSPVVSDGKLYVNSNDRNVYCLNAYTGEPIWTFQTNEPKMTTFGSTPAVVGDRVIIGPDDSNIYCLDADSGDEIWRVSTGTYRPAEASLGQHNIRSSPVIYNNKIYVGSMHDGKLYCVSMSGSVEWSTEIAGGDPILGSPVTDGTYIYIMGWDANIYKLDMNGNILLNFQIATGGSSMWSSFWGVNSFTPTVDGERLWVGGTNDQFRCYNTTDGELIYEGTQPNVEGETSHGSMVYVPGWLMNTAVDINGTEITCNDGFLISQAGPTVACARADNGENVWSAWGCWQVWSTPLFSGFGDSALVYFGSDSYSITCLDANTGVPISWYTTGGNVVSSAAVWDGKLYVGSYDNNIYCFEDHVQQNMLISASVDTNTVSVADSEEVTVTATLTGDPWTNVYESIGADAPVPPMADTDILVTYTSPDGVETNLDATTDKNGMATVTFTPDATGDWKVMAWYMGEDGAVASRTYAFSSEIIVTATASGEPADALIASAGPELSTINAGESVTLTATTSGGTADFTYQWYQIIDGNAAALSGETAATLVVAPSSDGTFGYYCEVTDAAGQVDSSDTVQVKVGGTDGDSGLPMEYIYAIVGVIAVVLIAIVAYMVLKKRK